MLARGGFCRMCLSASPLLCLHAPAHSLLRSHPAPHPDLPVLADGDAGTSLKLLDTNSDVCAVLPPKICHHFPPKPCKPHFSP